MKRNQHRDINHCIWVSFSEKKRKTLNVSDFIRRLYIVCETCSEESNTVLLKFASVLIKNALFFASYDSFYIRSVKDAVSVARLKSALLAEMIFFYVRVSFFLNVCGIVQYIWKDENNQSLNLQVNFCRIYLKMR